jgi:hypothetical protein
MKRCNDCLFSLDHGRGALHCHHPTVNRERPSFLAGNPQSAMTAFAERQNVVGRCGRAGRLWISRDPTGPTGPAEPAAAPRAPVDDLDI